MNDDGPVETWLSVGSLDRAEAYRCAPDWVAAQWHDPSAGLVLVDGSGAVASTADRRGPARITPHGDFDPERHLFLGLGDGRPWFAAHAEVTGPTASLRQLGAVLTGLQLELVVGAVALLAWHRLEPYCPTCGHRTEVRCGGAARWCETCRASRFPRQDPAVIVAVLDGEDRILLGRQPNWDPGRVSVLAGFVEAGESLEQAVHREVLEESGVRLGEVRYQASQPWPFPRSLMLGFVARATDTRLRIDHTEIESADWYGHAELERALADGKLLLPGEASIAHRLIAGWRQHRL